MKGMKRLVVLVALITGLAVSGSAVAQCSICTKTAQQLGHKPAKALNAGIIYLMMAPLAIMGVVGFRWWKNNGRQ
jgi:F0F1-type ATP synthase membrane subunit c/vacuolar-type H+-ATPase subunit K